MQVELIELGISSAIGLKLDMGKARLPPLLLRTGSEGEGTEAGDVFTSRVPIAIIISRGLTGTKKKPARYASSII